MKRAESAKADRKAIFEHEVDAIAKMTEMFSRRREAIAETAAQRRKEQNAAAERDNERALKAENDAQAFGFESLRKAAISMDESLKEFMAGEAAREDNILDRIDEAEQEDFEALPPLALNFTSAQHQSPQPTSQLQDQHENLHDHDDELVEEVTLPARRPQQENGHEYFYDGVDESVEDVPLPAPRPQQDYGHEEFNRNVAQMPPALPPRDLQREANDHAAAQRLHETLNPGVAIPYHVAQEEEGKKDDSEEEEDLDRRPAARPRPAPGPAPRPIEEDEAQAPALDLPANVDEEAFQKEYMACRETVNKFGIYEDEDDEDESLIEVEKDCAGVCSRCGAIIPGDAGYCKNTIPAPPSKAGKEDSNGYTLCMGGRKAPEKYLGWEGTNAFNSIFKPAAEWQCDMCTAKNSNSHQDCICCEKPRDTPTGKYPKL